MTRFRHLERRIEDALTSLAHMHREGMLPPALQPLLSLAPPNGTLVEVELDQPFSEEPPRNGDSEYWEAGKGRAFITFADADGEQGNGQDDRDALADLIEVLLDAEDNPQLHFVALKFLRDRLLPQSRLPWARSPHACQSVIADAIERGILATSKKPNPRNPDYPVTAVELNREHPVAASILEDLETDRGGSDAQDELAATS